MPRLLRRLLTLALVFHITPAPAAEMNSEQLFEKFKPAVVRINILQQGVPVGFGSGFFVSGDGMLITNKHVAELGLSGQFTSQFMTSEGEIIKTFSVGRCGDSRGIDLCLLKLDHKPKAWFTPKPLDFKIGQVIYTIGHPKGFDFTISQGLVSGVRKITSDYRMTEGPTTIETVQINAPISPGNSGGPAFNAKGELVGVSTWTLAASDAKELNFTVSVNEVVEYLKNPVFVSKKAYLDAAMKRDRALKESVKKKVTDPAFAVIAANEKAKAKVKTLDPEHWSPIDISSPHGTYSTFVPKSLANNCEKQLAPEGLFLLECKDLGPGGGVLQFTFLPSTNPRELLRSKRGKTPDPVPFPIVKGLMQSGEWDAISKKLTPNQRKFLFSVPGKLGCDEKPTFYHPGSHTTWCTRHIFNDAQPDASSWATNIAREGSPYVVQVLGWSPRAFSAGIYFFYAEIAATLLNTDGVLKPTEAAAVTPPVAVRTGSDANSLKKVLTVARDAMMAYKSNNGTYPRDLAKVGAEKNMDALGLPKSFVYRIFVVPACVRQSKTSDKTEWTNITEKRRGSAAERGPISRVDKAAESMNDKLVDMKCPNPREDFRIIGIGYENDVMTIALVDRRKVDVLNTASMK